jgi:drug/metabolite transporter (DMT)-like permease
VAALVAATLFWAGNYVLAAEAVQTVDPWSLSLLRWAPAAIILLVCAVSIERPDWRLVLRHLPRLAIMGLLGMIGFGAILYVGLRTTTAVSASLIGSIAPVLIAITAAIVLKERTGWRTFAGLPIALAGVVLVISKGSVEAFTHLRITEGDLWVLLATACWAVYTVLGRKPLGIPPLTSTGVQAAVVTVILIPIVAVNGLTLPTTPAVWGIVAFIAVFPSVGSYLLWNIALRTFPAANAGIFLNLIPVFTVIIALAIGKSIVWAEGVGGLLVLAGVLLATIPTRRRVASSA